MAIGLSLTDLLVPAFDPSTCPDMPPDQATLPDDDMPGWQPCDDPLRLMLPDWLERLLQSLHRTARTLRSGSTR